MAEPGVSRPWPLFLLLRSTSLSAGGLFIDFTPWVLAGFGALLFSALLWLPLVHGVTRALSQMTTVTEQIAQGNFEAKVQQHRRDELGRLGQAINSMAGRLSSFVTGQKRFLGDVAHELCSPLARIQVALGILEQRADDKQKAYVDDVREEVQHMSGLIDELLSFSRAGLAGRDIQLQPVQLRPLIETVVQREVGDTTQIEPHIPADLRVHGEPQLLSRAIANLLRNAIRYAGTAGPIRLTAERENSNVRILVQDDGPGVPEAALERIFDPFYRAEASRSRDTGGIGLGLTIVKTCIEACQGTVQARNRHPRGLEVNVTLRHV
jgi:two-component system sensor histidine kinase CpxA